MKKRHTQLLSEINIRNNVRKMIVENVKKNFEQEKNVELGKIQLCNLIRKVLLEVKIADQVPHKNTGINILTELFKKIVKILETGYKTLTTSPDQRRSYRTHILNAIIGAIAPPRVITRADIEKIAGKRIPDLDELAFDDSPIGDQTSVMPEPEPEENPLDYAELNEPISIQEIVGRALLEAVSIDVDDDPVRVNSERDEGIIDVDGEEDPIKDFTLGEVEEGADMTGRNVAYETFRKLESDIIDSYMVLSNDDDRQMFYIYLLVNTMLYFDRFENELQATLQEPNMDEYKEDNESEEEFDISDISG